MDMSPTNVGYKFRSPTARKLIAKFQFVEQIGASSKMLLMFLYLTKSLGHVRVCKITIPCVLTLTPTGSMCYDDINSVQ